MGDITRIEGDFNAAGIKFAILVSRFNSFVVDSLVSGAIDTLVRHGADKADITVTYVPGAWEQPIVAQRLAANKKHDAIIALGAVIRGGTPHFEYVAGECVKGLSQVSMNHDIPVINGVLTVDTIEQAIERSGTKAGNKGGDAAMAASETVNVLRAL